MTQDNKNLIIEEISNPLQKTKKFNVFEGARRISLIIWILGLVCICVSNWGNNRLELYFTIVAPNKPIVRVNEDLYLCSKDSVSKTSFIEYEGVKINAQFCFLAQEYQNGQMLIPYKCSEDNKCWGNSSFSSEVSNYIYTRLDGISENVFLLKDSDKAYILENEYKPFREDLFEILKYSVWFSISFIIFVYTVGWVIRGFFRIPNGKDYREE